MKPPVVLLIPAYMGHCYNRPESYLTFSFLSLSFFFVCLYFYFCDFQIPKSVRLVGGMAGQAAWEKATVFLERESRNRETECGSFKDSTENSEIQLKLKPKTQNSFRILLVSVKTQAV